MSKLNTLRDGLRIARTILLFIKEEQPLQFFASIAAMFAVTGNSARYPDFPRLLRDRPSATPSDRSTFDWADAFGVYGPRLRPHSRYCDNRRTGK